MNPILPAPIVQFEYPTDSGPVRGPLVAPVLTLKGATMLREAHRHGTPVADGGRVVEFVEDPWGVVGGAL